MEFPSQADYELLIYTLPQNHPDVISSSLHLYTTSRRGTAVIRGSIRFRNGLELPPGISFTAPNLPTLIADCIALGAGPTAGPSRTLRERDARYVVDTQGQAIAVLLTLEEYEHYLDLLDDEADSQDSESATGLSIPCLQAHSGV